MARSAGWFSSRSSHCFLPSPPPTPRHLPKKAPFPEQERYYPNFSISLFFNLEYIGLKRALILQDSQTIYQPSEEKGENGEKDSGNNRRHLIAAARKFATNCNLQLWSPTSLPTTKTEGGPVRHQKRFDLHPQVGVCPPWTPIVYGACFARISNSDLQAS